MATLERVVSFILEKKILVESLQMHSIIGGGPSLLYTAYWKETGQSIGNHIWRNLQITLVRDIFLPSCYT
jgi:hypothetical protein